MVFFTTYITKEMKKKIAMFPYFGKNARYDADIYFFPTTELFLSFTKAKRRTCKLKMK